MESDSLARACRSLMATARFATLSTLAREPDGYPFGSLVATVSGDRGEPLLLLSAMAEHRKNLDHRSQASLFVMEGGLALEPAGRDESPLARARLTLLGRGMPVESAAIASAQSAFLRAHPDAERYLGYGDFAFYRLRIEAIRYVGGFGRMGWVDPQTYAEA